MEKIFKDKLIEYGFEKNIDGLEEFADMLIDVNKTHNLTAITDDEQVALKHFVDSLMPVKLGLVKGKRILDVGTGGGFPGVPLAIVGEWEVSLLDSSAKKLEFLKSACEKLQISATTVNARAEEVATGALRESFDTVVSRAVAALPVLLELTAPFVKVGGRLIAYKGVSENTAGGKKAAKILGFDEGKKIDCGIDGLEHCLFVYEKIKKTPEKYPRRYAQIKKEPLV